MIEIDQESFGTRDFLKEGKAIRKCKTCDKM